LFFYAEPDITCEVCEGFIDYDDLKEENEFDFLKLFTYYRTHVKKGYISERLTKGEHLWKNN